jgi:hypothetical protein
VLTAACAPHTHPVPVSPAPPPAALPPVAWPWAKGVVRPGQEPVKSALAEAQAQTHQAMRRALEAEEALVESQRALAMALAAAEAGGTRAWALEAELTLLREKFDQTVPKPVPPSFAAAPPAWAPPAWRGLALPRRRRRNSR